MGGCRCSYRNCNVRTDGQTHMFHYPVFDRPRCHQWLTNAQRLEFLNLKVSQLRNRVVCQYHFQDEYFMNFMKDKLRFDAVPTEDGPFCTSGDILKEHAAPETVQNYPITPEDIENERLSCNEKKAIISVKYADFLTNGEMEHYPYYDNPVVKYNKNAVNKISLLPKTKPNKDPIQPLSNNFKTLKRFNSQGKRQVKTSQIDTHTNKPGLNTEGDSLAQLIQVPSKYDTNPSASKSNKIKILSEKKIYEPLCLKGKLEPVSPSLVLRARNRKDEVEVKEENILRNKVEVEIEFLDKSENMPNNNVQQAGSYPVLLESQVQNNDITSMLTTTQEVQLGPLTMQSQIPQEDIQSLLKSIQFVEPNLPELQDQANVAIMQENTQDPMFVESQNVSTPLQIPQPHSQTSPSTPSSKAKIPPERVAAIEEKRKFNKLKLRDMIEFCLDELEDQDNRVTEKKTKIGKTSPHKDIKNIYDGIKLENISVPNHHIKSLKPDNISAIIQNDIDMSTEVSLVRTTDMDNIDSRNTKALLLREPNQCNMSSLEARLIRMEKCLLDKIEQNSREITDLKNTLARSPCEKQSINTQTSESEVSHKKKLFNEISKYLSPDANNLVYEELFINMYAQNTSKSLPNTQEDSSLVKRRRRR